MAEGGKFSFTSSILDPNAHCLLCSWPTIQIKPSEYGNGLRSYHRDSTPLKVEEWWCTLPSSVVSSSYDLYGPIIQKGAVTAEQPPLYPAESQGNSKNKCCLLGSNTVFNTSHTNRGLLFLSLYVFNLCISPDEYLDNETFHQHMLIPEQLMVWHEAGCIRSTQTDLL